MTGLSLSWALAPSAFAINSSNRGTVNSAGVQPSDGALSGWVYDAVNPARTVTVNFYLDGQAGAGGTLLGNAPANITNLLPNYSYPNVTGNHGFYFSLPATARDGRPHTISAQPLNADGSVAAPLYNGTVAFTLPAGASVNSAPASGSDCLGKDSRCPSVSDSYFAPNYPDAQGWGDGINYFEKWGCKSSAGFNYIARMNILPLGTMGPDIYKDSGADWENDTAPAGAIYFDLADNKRTAKWAIKKAIYNPALAKWEIFSVLDSYSTPAGVSSHAGTDVNFVMNDYALPGFGPSSPVPGSKNKIPGVSNTSANSTIPSYPLVGSGPLGITTITGTVHPGTAGVPNGPQGQTCIHMNPKLMDYDASYVPHTLLANLFQGKPGQPCTLPDGTQLPGGGNYLYRYQGKDLGWQLDLSAGMISDSLSDPAHKFNLMPRHLAGTAHTLVSTNWYDGGVIDFIDLDQPASNNARRVLDCSAAGVYFGGVSGASDRLFVGAASHDFNSDRIKYHLSSQVPVPGDLFYVFKVPAPSAKP